MSPGPVERSADRWSAPIRREAVELAAERRREQNDEGMP